MDNKKRDPMFSKVQNGLDIHDVHTMIESNQVQVELCQELGANSPLTALAINNMAVKIPY